LIHFYKRYFVTLNAYLSNLIQKYDIKDSLCIIILGIDYTF